MVGSGGGVFRSMSAHHEQLNQQALCVSENFSLVAIDAPADSVLKGTSNR
jgi:hypothetical protein